MKGDVITRDYFEITTGEQQFLNAEQAFHYQIVPKCIGKHSLEFYIDELHFSHSLVDELELVFGLPVTLEKADSNKVQRTLTRYYRRRKHQQNGGLNLSYRGEQDFLRKLIIEAHHLGSSDIHLEPYEDKCRVRIRIDGKLVERYEVPMVDYPPIVNKIKIQGHLDIAEKRLPQDGRIEFNDDALKFDIRVSVLPTLHGEKIVMRLLSRDDINIDLAALGFDEEDLKEYMEAVKKPNGIILVSGPTGSGKTTTLYATLKQLNEESRNILTIEDPIEYTLQGVNQVQLKESIGLDFASAMRTFLRQDPDVIMLGEIRDKDTVQMAIRAALTGHMVFSTIHTNSAWGTITRLMDMGVPPFLIANTLNLSVAQRLVRLLCEHCKQKEQVNPEELPIGFNTDIKLNEQWVPIGCEECYYTGYKGRKAIYELISIDRELSEAIKENKGGMHEELKNRGVKTLADKAFQLLINGETALEEVYSLLMK